METLRPAAQDCRISRFEAQRRCISRNVRAALVNDSDHAERYAYPSYRQAVGPLPFGEDLTQRIRQPGDGLHGGSHCLDSSLIKHQAIEHCAAQPPLLGFAHIGGVRRQDLAAAFAYRVCRRQHSVVAIVLARQCRQQHGELAPAEEGEPFQPWPKNPTWCVIVHYS